MAEVGTDAVWISNFTSTSTPTVCGIGQLECRHSERVKKTVRRLEVSGYVLIMCILICGLCTAYMIFVARGGSLGAGAAWIAGHALISFTVLLPRLMPEAQRDAALTFTQTAVGVIATAEVVIATSLYSTQCTTTQSSNII